MTTYRLTKEQIEHHIADVEYNLFGETGTQCVITLGNGYTVTGESNVIDPEIYDAEIGKQVAYENAFDKLWGILGYQVKLKWHFETQVSPKERVGFELATLENQREKLMSRLAKPQGEIKDESWRLLHEQADAMAAYIAVLQHRLEKWGE